MTRAGEREEEEGAKETSNKEDAGQEEYVMMKRVEERGGRGQRKECSEGRMWTEEEG